MLSANLHEIESKFLLNSLKSTKSAKIFEKISGKICRLRKNAYLCNPNRKKG